MTDDEYNRLLRALAGKHVKLRVSYPADEITCFQSYQNVLKEVSETARLWKNASADLGDAQSLTGLFKKLKEYSPVKTAERVMEEVGILAALDEDSGLVLREFRRSVIPVEDIGFLLGAGFSDDEIEVLLCIAVERARELGRSGADPSRVLVDASQALSEAAWLLEREAPVPEKKKRKIWNGIGKLLGGAVTGIGNVLLVVPAIFAASSEGMARAIASGGQALSLIFAGVGDLRGE